MRAWRVRPLVLVVSAIQIVDLSLLSAIGPLLPELDQQFDLGPAGAGRIVAAYALGSLVTTIPAGILAGRIGYRRAVVLGLLAMAASSLAFGLVSGELALEAARFGQGVASAISWAAGLGWVAQATEPERRGATLGIVMGATVAGSLAGPALGALAAQGDRRLAFAAVAAVALLLILPTLRLPSVPAVRQPLASVVRSLRSPRLLIALWLFLLPAFLIAALSSIAPLELSSLGWSAAGIGAISIVGAVIQMGSNPALGRWSDRRSRLAPVFGALIVSALVSVLLAAPFVDSRWSLAALVLAANIAFAAFFVPASALLADAVDAARVEQSFGFALANLAWSPGAVLGSLIAGALAASAGDEAAYVMLASICAVTLVAFVAGRSRLRAGTTPNEVLD
jgi:predicted MFS family arabinose efflux permease